MQNKLELKMLMTTCSSALMWLVGGWNIILGILATVIVCDYISGIMSAAKSKTLNSSVGWAGLLKKAATVLIVVVAHQIDIALGNSGDIIRNITALFYISNEILSIFENVGELGVPLPAALKEACEKLKNAGKP